MSEVFELQNPDREKSPFTGMTRKHWLDAGRYLLKGVFSRMTSLDQPIVLKRRETAVTYPQPGDPDWRFRSEEFEGLARTLLVAGPLIADEPEIEIEGIPLAEFYSRRITASMNPDSPEFVGSVADMTAVSGDKLFQQTCECCSLAIGLVYTRDVIWDKMNERERQNLFSVFHDFGHYKTHNHNWRMFNLLILTFLRLEGQEVDEAVFEDHLSATLGYYSGDGWYRDGGLFDYYSVWAFQFYLPIWNQWWGVKHDHPSCETIIKNHQELMADYAKYFDSSGRQILWGRSGIYRFAASAPFATAFLQPEPGIAPGLARKVMSANLLQFLQHPDFLVEGIPSLGFYGQHPELVQTYSCAASPFWFGNAFVALHLPEDSHFWTSQEKEVPWEAFEHGVDEVYQRGPGISVSRYEKTDVVETRTAKVLSEASNARLVNYSRLSFNSVFLWQAPTDEGIQSMHYTLKSSELDARFRSPNCILDGGVRGGVRYRRLVFGFRHGFANSPVIDLADIPVAYGLLRFDRVKIALDDAELILAHYGLPTDGETYRKREIIKNDYKATIVSFGERQLAMVRYFDWGKMEKTESKGVHPSSANSVLLHCAIKLRGRYSGAPLLVTGLFHKTDSSEWTEDELNPVAEWISKPKLNQDSLALKLNDGRSVSVSFRGVDGNLTL